MTLVSIVVPTYNRTDLLMTRCLPSILSQTHQELDVHVVGDGTEAATGEAIAALGDPRVRFTNLPHQEYPEDPGTKWCLLGLEARNHGLDTALGEYVGGLDDDDAFTPDHVEILLKELLLEHDDFAYGRSEAHWVDGSVSWYGNWPPGHFQFCDGAGIWSASLPYRYDKECVARGLPEDGDLWDRMVAGGVRFAFLNRIVHHYYPNPR